VPYYQCESEICGKVFSEYLEHNKRGKPVKCQFCEGPTVKTTKPLMEKKKPIKTDVLLPIARGGLTLRGPFK